MWLSYALFAALGNSIIAPLAKRTSKHLHITLYFFFYNLLSVAFLFLLLEAKTGLPRLESGFYFNVVMSALLDIVAFLAATYAVKHYPISLLAPISAFGPVFATFISIFTLHEYPTVLKLLGTLVIVVGAYLLDISAFREGVFAPIKKLFFKQGCSIMPTRATYIWYHADFSKTCDLSNASDQSHRGLTCEQPTRDRFYGCRRSSVYKI